MKVYQNPVARAVPFDNLTNSFNALNSQTAIEEATVLAHFGAGSDGDVSLSSGTTTLTRTMYYNNLTLSGTAVLKPNGFKIYVRGTLSLSGSASIDNSGNNGTNASGNTAGVAGAAIAGIEVGSSGAGTNGATQNNDAADVSGTLLGYGGSGSNGGSGGGNTNSQGNGGAVSYYPEHTLRHDHILVPATGAYKSGGAGGGGGGGGTPSLFATAGAGGGGGSGGGCIVIFARTFQNSSSVGIVARGGNGGNGGNASRGNSGGGGGAGGGGGGHIYLVGLDIFLGNIDVSGGTGGNGGSPNGSGAVGGAGIAGSVGHYAIYSARTGSWTVA